MNEPPLSVNIFQSAATLRNTAPQASARPARGTRAGVRIAVPALYAGRELAQSRPPRIDAAMNRFSFPGRPCHRP